MEPQYMMIGQAAGNTAALAIQDHIPVGKVNVSTLQKKLRAQNAILHIEQEIMAKEP
jgi:hypothetical protein